MTPDRGEGKSRTVTSAIRFVSWADEQVFSWGWPAWAEVNASPALAFGLRSDADHAVEALLYDILAIAAINLRIVEELEEVQVFNHGEGGVAWVSRVV